MNKVNLTRNSPDKVFLFASRYQYAKMQPVTPEEMKKFGVTMKKRQEVTLESEYDKVKGIDIENWSNKRGPRPWEEEGLTTTSSSPATKQ